MKWKARKHGHVERRDARVDWFSCSTPVFTPVLAPEANIRLLSCQMLRYVHQLDFNFDCLPFVAEQIVLQLVHQSFF